MNVQKVSEIDLNTLSSDIAASLKEIEWRIQGKHYSELYIEKNETHIQAVAIIWNSSFHPFAKYIHFTEQISPQFLSTLLSYEAPKTAIMFSCYETEQIKCSIAAQHGFTLFRKTYMESYIISELLDKLQHVESEQNAYPLQSIISNPKLERDLFSLLKRNYDETHLHNPALDVDWQAWKNMLIDDAPDFQNSLVIIDHTGHVGAYIFVHQISEDHYEIGWMGQRIQNDLLPLLKLILTKLSTHNIKTVDFEIDSTNFYTWPLTQVLQFNKKISFNSYLYK